MVFWYYLLETLPQPSPEGSCSSTSSMTAVSLLCIAILRVCSSISFVVASTEADKTTDCITTVVGVVDTGLCVPGHQNHKPNTVMNPQPPSLCLDDDDCLACLSLCLVDSHDARSLSGAVSLVYQRLLFLLCENRCIGSGLVS
ncbi:unnamed protein product [Euphydryas editha]|uniref:Secreted protein n=1 Tax=Euphydryas editha TaxID=104508 RepID=A0AAU9THL7_EUPED|nr:unnamed protein product [Euphydryas editha]